jgi:glycosyltransferase involved in cell wall biosynthesis
MKHTPPVTVLLPVYNAGKYVADAIGSVLRQDFTDFELLIINDGSKDHSADVIAGYDDPRIRVLHQENIGLVATLNRGLAVAAGEYIARFDADDICYPTRLREQLEFLRANPDYVLVGAEADYMDEAGNYIFTYRFRDYEDAEIKANAFRQCPVIHASVMYRKQAVIDAGGYDPRAVTFEDHMLWRNLAAFGKMKNMRHPLIKVRFNPDSVTIDEKWRGREFITLKRDSIARGYLTDGEVTVLRDILKRQDFSAYKQAAYYSMIGKKYLWNDYRPRDARRYLRKAIAAIPYKPEPYLLYLLSFLPGAWIRKLYRAVKGR